MVVDIKERSLNKSRGLIVKFLQDTNEETVL